MIIPKAIFLRVSFEASMSHTEKRAKTEMKLILSTIIKELRNAQNHKLGMLDVFVSKDKFPILAKGAFSMFLDEVENNLIDAGYRVDILRNGEGLVFHVDWTKNE